MDDLISLLTNPQIILMAITTIGVAATILTVALPLMERDQMRERMRAVATEREAIRARERSRLNGVDGKIALRSEPKAYMRQIVERFNLRNVLADAKTADLLKQAGFRGQAPLTVYLFARFVLPFAAFGIALFYLFVVLHWDKPPGIKFAAALGAAGLGLYLPNIFLNNLVQKRQQSIKRAWPDALDLLLICVESGMSIEMAMRRVAEEVGAQSIPLAEEMSLTTAELSFLQERRKAYENLTNRTGLEQVKGVCTALIQAEKYGTPLGQALRVLAQESRDMRMSEAEKKAAALPPKLTVPMIVFFLPVLFIVIMGPAMISVFHGK
jgi:tight adherence protein C